jgi:acetoin:2,6-dichlorophenolindophenol oxidoreductase subunit beta
MPDTQNVTFREAVIDAIRTEMLSDAGVYVMGEDVGAAGGVFKQAAGLFDEFGEDRVVDTPISEPGAFGIAVGSAMAGMRPIFEVMYGDFMTLIMDQLVNQAAKVHYMSNGQFKAPMVIRTTMGTGSFGGPQHSQSLHAWVAHIPGLKLVVPATAADAKGLYTAAIRDDNPVVIFEDRLLYSAKGAVPTGEHVVPLGKAQVVREGEAVTVITVGRMLAHALKAADQLAAEGVSIEIIDIRSLVPLDTDTCLASLRKTNRVLVVDNGVRGYGVGAEIAATLSDVGFDWLDAPIARLGAVEVPIPFSRTLEPLVQPDVERIVKAVRALV